MPLDAANIRAVPPFYLTEKIDKIKIKIDKIKNLLLKRQKYGFVEIRPKSDYLISVVDDYIAVVQKSSESD